MKISGPVNCQQTLHVKYNIHLNMYEGLPSEWREILELPQQINEIEDIDESLKINREKLIIPENPQITIYEVKQKLNIDGTQASFIITGTQKVESRGNHSSYRS